MCAAHLRIARGCELHVVRTPKAAIRHLHHARIGVGRRCSRLALLHARACLKLLHRGDRVVDSLLELARFRFSSALLSCVDFRIVRGCEHGADVKARLLAASCE